MLVVMVRVAVPPPQRAKQFLMLNVPWDTHPFSSSPEVDEKYLVDVETKLNIVRFSPRISEGSLTCCPANDPPVITPVNSYSANSPLGCTLNEPKSTVPPLSVPE